MGERMGEMVLPDSPVVQRHEVQLTAPDKGEKTETFGKRETSTHHPNIGAYHPARATDQSFHGVGFRRRSHDHSRTAHFLQLLCLINFAPVEIVVRAQFSCELLFASAG